MSAWLDRGREERSASLDRRGDEVRASHGASRGRSSLLGRIGAWRSYWFAPADPAPLGLCRALFFGVLLLRVAPDLTSAPWAEVAPVFWMPTDLFRLLHLGVLPGPWLAALDVVWRVALALACVGLCTRAATATSFVVGTYLLGLPQCFGKVDHWSGLLVLTMGVMALARCGDAWSLDELRRRRREAVARLPSPSSALDRGRRERAPSGEYRWPVELARLLLVLVFFAGGIAKLRQGGLAWLDPDNMRAILLVPHYANDRVLPDAGLLLASMPVACGLLAALTVLLEVGAPLALLGGWTAAPIVGGLLAMQAGIGILMGVHASLPFLACYVFWLPWRGAMRAAIRRDEEAALAGVVTTHAAARSRAA